MIKPFYGILSVSGDKSISHRALILSSQAVGKTTIHNISSAQDVFRTINALKMLGVTIKRVQHVQNTYEVSGVGIGGLSKPENVLNMGNSGTSARLLTGLLSTYPFNTFIAGDSTLCNRPMKQIIKPLKEMCVDFLGENLPIVVLGSQDTIPIEYTLPFSSAQLKSAILLAALNTQGISTIIEPRPFSRDHTEIMLKYFKAPFKVRYDQEGTRHLVLEGQPELRAVGDMEIPSDPSSSAFLVAAALITPGSNILIKKVCVNPTRIEFYNIVKLMGGDVSFTNASTLIGEKVADVRVKYSKLHSINVSAEQVPAMIDEFPILSILAAYAEGKTCMLGLGSLRYKESDRISSIVNGLKACGVKAYEHNADIVIEGNSKVKGGCKVRTHKDHRIAMSFIICGLCSEKPISVDSVTMIKTSFPEFLDIFSNARTI